MSGGRAVGWWAGKTRQFVRHLSGRVSDGERAQLRGWLTRAQFDLFERMHRADQRHGLDVVAALRAAGHTEHDVLLAGLLHDAGKGRGVGLWPRVAWSLGERYGSRILRLTGWLPGFSRAFARLARHAEISAELARAAGCGERAATLIREQSHPTDPVLGEALRLADEAN